MNRRQEGLEWPVRQPQFELGGPGRCRQKRRHPILPPGSGCGCDEAQCDQYSARQFESDRCACLRSLSALLSPGRNSERERDETAPVEDVVNRSGVSVVVEVPPIDTERIRPEKIHAAPVQQLPLLLIQGFATKLEGCQDHCSEEDIARAALELIAKVINLLEVVPAVSIRHHEDEQALPRHRDGKAHSDVLAVTE